MFWFNTLVLKSIWNFHWSKSIVGLPCFCLKSTKFWPKRHPAEFWPLSKQTCEIEKISRGNVFPPAEIHFIFIAVAIKRGFYCLHVTNLKSRRFPEKTFDIITCTVKIFYKLLMIIYPNWKTKENYKILLTLPYRWMTKFMISFQIAFLPLHTNFQKLCQLFVFSYFSNLIFMTIVLYQSNFFCLLIL